MRIAETVTFGGSGLDRAAHLRGAATEMSRAAEARFIVLWRGKLLLNAAGDALARLPGDHPLLQIRDRTFVFLGLDDGVPTFAASNDAWVPEDGETPGEGFFDKSVQTHPDCADGEGFAELRNAMIQLTPRDAEMAATAKAVLGWHRTHKFCSRCGAESLPAMGGWQRDCPSCDGKHFPRTDPVVIMLVTHGNSVLLGRSPGWPEGMYSCLAGFVEPGEPIEAAVRREVFEETGVRVGAVRYLSSQPWPFPSSLMFGCHGEALSTNIEIDPNEIEDARWFTREEIADALAGTHPELLPARPGAIARFLLVNWLADRLD